MAKIVDNSRLVATASCSTQALLRYHFGYTSVEEKIAAEAGKGAHKALAAFFKGESVEASIEEFSAYYKAMAEENVPSTDRLAWVNVADVMQEFFDTHPIDRFPFEPMVEHIETGVQVPLVDDIEFFALIDLPVREKNTGALYPVDHKTTGKISSWWAKKFRIGSQMTGYVWAMQQKFGEQSPGAFINAIEFSKLPDSTKKCKVHKVPYIECRKQHMKSDLFIVGRDEYMLTSFWLGQAKMLAKRFFALCQAYPTLEYLQYAPVEGQFNDSCTFCEFKDFCLSGRKPELVEGLYVYKPWEPWEGEI